MLTRADARIDGAFRLARAWGVKGIPALITGGKAVDPFDPDAIRAVIEESR